jgi:hypothetical protein
MRQEAPTMEKQVYVARSRVVQDEGIYRRVFMGDSTMPITLGIMGAAKHYYGYDAVHDELPGTMDYLPAMVGA